MANTPVFGFDYESPDDLPGETLTGGQTGVHPILAIQVEQAIQAQVASLQGSINGLQATIDDLEAAKIGRLATTIRTTNTSGFSSETVVNTVTADLIAGRTYRVRWPADVAGSGGATVARIRIREDNISGTVLQLSNVLLTTSGARDVGFILEAEYTAGSDETKTFVATGQRLDGTGTVAFNGNVNEPQYLYVDFIRE